MGLYVPSCCLAGAEVELHGDVLLLYRHVVLLEGQIALQIDLPLLSGVLCLETGLFACHLTRLLVLYLHC